MVPSASRPTAPRMSGRQTISDSTVTELDASTGANANGTLAASTIAVGGSPKGVPSDGTHVWVANEGANTVTELDASRTGAYANGTLAASTIGVGSFPQSISSDGTHVWVANWNDDTVTEIAIPLQITTSSLPGATVGQTYSFQLQATGGTPPYTWNKYPPGGRGVLPIWLHLSKSGLISGHTEEGGHLHDHRQVSGGDSTSAQDPKRRSN